MADWWDGQTEGRTVYMEDGRASPVLGPDGQPVKYTRRYVAGFDLRPQSNKTSDSGEAD